MRAKELLERWILHHVETGERLSMDALCEGDEALARVVRRLLADYDQLLAELDPVADGIGSSKRSPGDSTTRVDHRPKGTDDERLLAPKLPEFEGFRTVEVLGRGGGGEVYRLLDLELDRTVAGKILRPDSPLRATVGDFLGEARALALFDDPRIVRLLDYRVESENEPALLLMEHVDGFPLDEVAPSLEYGQRARLVAEVAHAVEHAHSLGVLHNDLKPANILLDKKLMPKILDFGLSGSVGVTGSRGGTLPYMAPERFENDTAPDHRADVFSLGVILYELLCGQRPFRGATDAELMKEVLEASPRLAIEVESTVPEPLQAIALKALEREPSMRYQSADEMARDLERYLSGRPVLARPSLYRSVLGFRLRGHLDDIREWLDSKLVFPHEAERLRAVYRQLQARDEDWIVESRALTFSRIALYLGAFVVLFGSLLYLLIRTSSEGSALWQALVFLGIPFAGITACGFWHSRRELPRIATACLMASLGVLPFLLLILLGELDIAAPAGEGVRSLSNSLLGDLGFSNRQLQLTCFVAGAWAVWLALRTRTTGLSSAAATLWLAFFLGALGDFGLRRWLEEGELDRIALGLLPFAIVTWLAGWTFERLERSWFSVPLYLLSAVGGLLAVELLALEGEQLRLFGLSVVALQSGEVSDPLLLDTVTGMVINGFAAYVLATLIERFGTGRMMSAARLFFVLTPFMILKPLLYLSTTGEYSVRFDWLLLVLGVAVAFFSRFRQRKSFYYAGLFSVGASLWQLTSHYEWWQTPGWAGWIVASGVVTLALGVLLDRSEHRRRTDTPGR